ncbi:MAG TPA: nidogen-like domain-containing protein [Bacteroidia bacterium]|jgi:gliding motility-associated-like protein
MRNILYTILFIALICQPLLAQKTVLVPAKVYAEMKSRNALKPGVRYEIINEAKATQPVSVPQKHELKSRPKAPRSAACNCMIPLDGTFNVAEFTPYTPPDYRNDDGSTNAKTLPFNFCLYGSTYNTVFINNNGNITFGNSITAFSAGGFPAGPSVFPGNDTVMIAPFWADVDTQNPTSGVVHYRITPTHMVVKWDQVGYYSSMADRVNDFQLIITDGNDPILPVGNNVALCYGDMQWTTGSASGGTGGFGGIPANAGVNKGDGINYFQIGRFDQTGSAYDGPYGSNDGVDYLDNKSYYFSTCAPGNNIPPVLSPYISICDSFKICNPNDTLVYLLSFSSPELGQNVSSITATAPTLGSGFTVLNTTLGQTGSILFRIIANPGLIGNHTITIIATDNGSPAASSVITYVVPILAGVPPPDPIVTVTPSVICANSGSATFTLTNASDYDFYSWSNGVSGAPLTVSNDSVYYLTASKDGCYKSTADSIKFRPSPTPLILGTLAICGGSTADLYVDSASIYPAIFWSTGSTNDSVSVGGGTYTVTVTDLNGCTATSPSVTVSASSLDITSSAATFCDGDSVLLTANANPSSGATYSWYNLNNTSTVYVDTTGSYFATVNYPNGCTISDTVSVFSIPIGTPTTTFSYTTPVCKLGANPTVIVPPAFTPGGNFSSTGGLSINPSTGVINLASSAAGTYTVTYNVPASACGPAGSSTATITINPPVAPVLNFSYQPAVCANDTNQFPTLIPGFDSGGVFTSTPGLSIVDSTGEIILASSTPGTYTITYTLASDTSLAGCRSGGSDTAVILINPLPAINITTDQVIWIGNSATIAANSDTAFTYIWNPGIGLSCTACDTTVASPPETTEYCVTVTDTIGCIDSSCVKIHVEIPCLTNSNLEMPNAFTPNGDGFNDELCLYGWTDCVEKFEIVIYDRWGELVYQSKDAGFCWDGVYKGNLMNTGVFVYFIKASFVVSGDTPLSPTSKNEVNKKGNITLVR